MTALLSRRAFLGPALAAGAMALVPRPLLAAVEALAREGAGDPRVRTLAFRNTHTGEALDVAFASGDRYLEPGLESINWVLRDHRTGDVAPIDPKLLDLLHLLRTEAAAPGERAVFEIISGYRSPHSNEALRERSGAVARRSLHLKGMAVDVRLPGVALPALRDAAIDLKRGGVGYYAGEFLHVDTGRVRRW
jgi:uncharacterized protein YcbK (DUF882 family)